jgi:formate dehydrogenase maturation protein FdhE
MIRKILNCDICGAVGSIAINTDVSYEDIQYCPVCSSPLLSDEDDSVEDEY